MSAMQDSGAQYGRFILISYPPTRLGELAAHECCQQTPADLASSSLSRVPKQSLAHAPPPFLAGTSAGLHHTRVFLGAQVVLTKRKGCVTMKQAD
jgi:hypothetical protein